MAYVTLKLTITKAYVTKICINFIKTLLYAGILQTAKTMCNLIFSKTNLFYCEI